MLYSITNNTNQIRTLHDANGRSFSLQPKKTVNNVEFTEQFAEQLRRFEMRDGQLAIRALDDDARMVLDRANKPARRKKPTNLLQRSRETYFDQMLRQPEPHLIRDELAAEDEPKASLGYDPDKKVTRDVHVNESPDQTEEAMDAHETDPPAQPQRRQRRG